MLGVSDKKFQGTLDGIPKILLYGFLDGLGDSWLDSLKKWDSKRGTDGEILGLLEGESEGTSEGSTEGILLGIPPG